MCKRRILITAMALIVAVAAASIAYADLSAGAKAPNFTLPTIDGKTFTLGDSNRKAGNVVVLDFWATWCPPCRASIPHLISLQKKFAGKGVTIVGVSLDQEKSTAAKFARDMKLNYTVANDPNGSKTSEAYKIQGIPAMYVIDKNGVIRYTHSGYPREPAAAKQEEAGIEQEVRTLLAK